MTYIKLFPKNTDHDLIHFLVKNKIPRLHSGMSNAARFLSMSLGFNSFLLRIWYTKLQCCSFETVRAQRAIHNYLNRRFINDKLLELLVKYHSINNSIATRKGAQTGLRNQARERFNEGLVQLLFSLIPSFCRSTVSLGNGKKVENYLRS